MGLIVSILIVFFVLGVVVLNLYIISKIIHISMREHLKICIEYREKVKRVNK